MNVTTVLTIIHWIGVGFIFLWFLGSCMKDGMWNNGVRCFNAFVAAMVSFPLTIALGFLIGLIIGLASGPPDPANIYLPLAMGMAASWIAFLVCFAIVQAITDRLSQLKVAFHPVANGIGSFIFICGITFVLFSYTLPIYGLVQLSR